MNADLRFFAVQWLRVVLMTLVPVAVVTFMAVPMALGHYPGEARPDGQSAPWHMT